MKLCVVIPVYNEDHDARANLGMIVTYTRRLPDTVVLVVNDGSQDRTEGVVHDLIASLGDDHVRLVTHAVNRGYGAADRTGGHYACDHGFDYVLFMDSDLTNHPKYLADFYRFMQAGIDYIKASRYSPGGGMAGVPWGKQAVSRVGNAVARVLFGLPVRDCTNGFRAVKTSVWGRMHLHEDRFALILEELYQAKFTATSFAEVPYVLTARHRAGKASSFVYRPSVIWNYLRYALKARLGQVPDLRPAVEPQRKD